jgi:hypothetical protein
MALQIGLPPFQFNTIMADAYQQAMLLSCLMSCMLGTS